MRYIQFDVRCPRDFTTYKMEIRVAILPDGSLLPSPCNGCDYMNGFEICTKCIDAIFKKSLADPLMKSYSQPIEPFLQ